MKKIHPAIVALRNLHKVLSAYPYDRKDKSPLADPAVREQLLALIEVGLADRHNVPNSPWADGQQWRWEQATATAWNNFYRKSGLLKSR